VNVYGFAFFNPSVKKEFNPTNVPIALNATVDIIATIKNARALSFIRWDKSENNSIFVFRQNKPCLLFNLRITYTLNCVNNKYVPTVTTMTTGTSATTTCAPLTYKEVA